MELIQTKSLLAKLMATENLHIEQRNVATASFDVEARILTIPILNKDISVDEYDLFLGHEVGHALYTPLDGLNKAFDMKLSMSVMNVLEDSRIERKVKYKYPGIRQSFIRAYKQLIARDFFGTAGKDLNDMNFIDRVNLYCKAGIDTGIVFTEFEKTLLEEIENTQIYDDVIEVCKKVLEYMKTEDREQELDKNSPLFDDFDESDDSDDNRPSGKSPYDQSGEEESDEYEDTEGENDEPGLDEGDDSETDVNSSAGGGIKGSQTHNPISHTDNAYRHNESRLFSEDSRRFFYGNVPDINLDEVVIDHKALWTKYHKEMHKKMSVYDPSYAGPDGASYNKLREDSKKVVSYLVKEFELRKNADQMSRASIAKTGELNMGKIFSYKFSEDLFKKVTVVPGGKSHGLVMFLDWSGSMAGNINNTIRQLLNLVMFCKKVSIPFEVYSFTTNFVNTPPYEPVTGKKDDMYLCPFNLMNILSSRMNSMEYTYAAKVLMTIGSRWDYRPEWFHLGGTPLNEAVVAAMKIVPMFQKQNKLQVVNTVFLTDGDGQRSLEIHNGLGGVYVQTGNKCVVIRDPVTKEEVVVDSRSARILTASYLKLLKARTKCNILGFYILNGREFGAQAAQLGLFKYKDEGATATLDKLKVEFRANKYKIITSAGFDEYYLLRSESLDTEDGVEFEVKENATVRGIATAFSKFTGNRKASRVVLNRFIGMII